MKTQTIRLDGIRIDGGTQPRVSLDESAIEEYAERMKAGDEFPPIRVFNDGSELWLSRGFHRYHAAVRAGWDKIEAESVQGTRRDAILDALGDNATHGVRRTNADKRKAVMTLLGDEEWAGWSDQEIARRCCVSPTTVGTHRSSLSKLDSEPRTYTTKHGTQAVMNTENIGRSARREATESPEPPRRAPLQFKHPNADRSMVYIGLDLDDIEYSIRQLRKEAGDEFLDALSTAWVSRESA